MVKEFDDAVRTEYVVILEEEDVIIVDIWWSVNLPNNPSEDELLVEFVRCNYGEKKFTYFKLDTLNRDKIGAL